MFTLDCLHEVGDELPRLLAAVLHGSRNVQVSTLVPEFSATLSHFLVVLGFQEIGQYEIMVKPLVRTIGSTGRVLATIS